MMLNDAEYTISKCLSRKGAVIFLLFFFQLMFYKTLRCSVPRPLSVLLAACNGGGSFLSNLVFIGLMTCISFDTATPVLDQQVYWLNPFFCGFSLITWVAGTGRFHLLPVYDLQTLFALKLDVKAHAHDTISFT